MAARIQQRELVSFDGTRLAYYAAGPRKAPPMVLCGGLGGGVGIWRGFFERFGGRFRVVHWDYRGLYGSGPAPDGRSYALDLHARDLHELIKHEGLEAPVLVGWSMGVQVALEIHRADPELGSALVLLNGAAGRPLDSAFDSTWGAQLSPWVLALLRRAGLRFSGVGPRLAQNDSVVAAFVWASQRLGLMAPGIDVRGFRDMAIRWTGLDLAVYAEIFDRLAEHDASDLLTAIRAPTLLIGGGADRLTPPRRSEEMAEILPEAELTILPDATHFGLLEYPDAILERVDGFLGERLERPTAERG